MKYIASMLGLLLLVACHSDEGVSLGVQDDRAIVLNVSGGTLGIDTRAEDIADSTKESAIAHLDIMIFNDAEEDDAKTLFYHERATVASSEGAVRLGVDVDDIEVGAKYWVYVVANSTHSAATYANIGSVEALCDLKQEDPNLHFTATGLQGTPSRFLMDGIAYMGEGEPLSAAAITIAEKPITNTVEMGVKLRRAAAKVVVKFIAT